jgi:hypothetical protein
VECVVNEEAAQGLGEVFGGRIGDDEAAAAGGDFGKRAAGAADAGTAMSQAFRDREAVAFIEGGITVKRQAA